MCKKRHTNAILLSASLALAALSSLSTPVAYADPLVMTFAGVASLGFDEGIPSDYDFAISMSVDPSSVQSLGNGVYVYSDLSGSFLVNGAFVINSLSEIEGVFVFVDDVAGHESISFSNDIGSNGLNLLNDPSLVGYDLTTAIQTKVATGSNVSSLGGQDVIFGGFPIEGGGDSEVSFTGVKSLSFTATGGDPGGGSGAPTAVTPEPPSLFLLATGLLSSVGFIHRRFGRV